MWTSVTGCEADHGTGDLPTHSPKEISMRFTLTLLGAVLACGTAMAQAPAGVGKAAQEINPNVSGGVAQQRGEMRNDMRTGGMVDHSMMDANKDGMVSQKEWNTYQNSMWRSMKADKKGNVAWSEVNTRMMGGAGGPVGSGGQQGAGQGGTPK
jgi:hypothetical protein